MSLSAKISRHLREHPLSYRLLAYIFAFSSVFTLAGTGIQLYWEYRSDVADIHGALRQIEQSYLDSLTASQWLLDDRQIRTQLNGILQLPDVRYVEIWPAEEGEDVIALGDPVSGSRLTRRYPMVYTQRGTEVPVGELRVVAALDGVYARMREQFLVILGTQAVRTFATSLFIVFVVQYLFTRHLQTLAEHARRLNLDSLNTRWTLKRRASGRFRPDELDLLVTAFEEMRTRLIDDLATFMAADAEREQLIADLESKNAEMERFTYTVTHDLKSPLITIQGFLGHVRQSLARGDEERTDTDLDRISSTASKMFRRVEDLLELARAGRPIGEPVEISLGELAREAVELVSGQIETCGARVEVAPDLPVVVGDRARLLGVLQNLLENSIKFMGDQPEPRVEIGVRSDAGELVCFVRDNGIGIAPEKLSDVFALFNKLNEGARGTGVGLAIVHQVITVHRGRIWVESEGRGQGCTFCFTLPRER